MKESREIWEAVMDQQFQRAVVRRQYQPGSETESGISRHLEIFRMAMAESFSASPGASARHRHQENV